MKRTCPVCNSLIFYKRIAYLRKAEKHNYLCRSCSTAKNNRTRKIINKKSLYEIWKIKFGEKIAKQKQKDRNKNISFFTKKAMENPDVIYRLKKSLTGRKLSDSHKNKLSLFFSGKGNPMYGKPSPQGSGNGWSCWYNDIFFRSLRELSYVLKLDKRKIEWNPAEKNISISYIDINNTKRTYRPNFIISNKYVIEIKPRKLWNSDNIIRKAKAAELWCENNNLIYKIRDTKISKDIILLHRENKIKFMKKYEDKIKKWTDGQMEN